METDKDPPQGNDEITQTKNQALIKKADQCVLGPFGTDAPHKG
jgi:hypothetical protein